MVNIFRGFSHTLAALTTNCSEFCSVWDQAEQGNGSRWEGEWRSEANGHHGLLLCVLVPTGVNSFKAHFRGTYSKVLRVCYGVELHVQPEGGVRKLEGDADLGQLAGGIYRYTGTLSEERLACTYACSYDHGVFELSRAVG